MDIVKELQDLAVKAQEELALITTRTPEDVQRVLIKYISEAYDIGSNDIWCGIDETWEQFNGN